MLVKFFDSPAPPGDYLILDTDYENYSAIFGCNERFGLSAGILTRESHPDSLIVSFNLFATSEPPKYSNSNSPNLCFDFFNESGTNSQILDKDFGKVV